MIVFCSLRKEFIKWFGWGNLKRLLFFLSIIILTIGIRSNSALGETLQNIHEGYTFSRNLIQDIKVSYTVTITSATNPSLLVTDEPIESCLWTKRYSDKKEYLRRTFQNRKLNYVKTEEYAFDGRETKLWYKYSGAHIPNYPGDLILLLDNRISTDIGIHPEFFYTEVYGMPISSILLSPGSSLKGNLENINSYPCYIIEGNKTGDRYQTRIWIDIEHGYIPRKIENYWSDGKIAGRWVISEVELYKLNNGYQIYYPKKAVRHFFKTDAQGNKVPDMDWYLQIDSVTINSGLPDSLFNLNYPKNVKIRDRRFKSP
jgi:hypothetical protein